MAVGGDAGREAYGGWRCKGRVVSRRSQRDSGRRQNYICVTDLVREIAFQVRAIVGRSYEIVGRAVEQVGNGSGCYAADCQCIGVGAAGRAVIDLITRDIGPGAWVPRERHSAGGVRRNRHKNSQHADKK